MKRFLKTLGRAYIIATIILIIISPFIIGVITNNPMWFFGFIITLPIFGAIVYHTS